MNYIDKREILSEFFQDKGYDLRKFQGFPDNSMVISKALNKEDALNVLDLYYELFIPVLGGDVLYLKQNGILDYTNDNWCIDRLNKETYFQFLKRSIDTSKDYIKNYRHPFLKDSSILFNIVPFDIENYEGQHQLSSHGDSPSVSYDHFPDVGKMVFDRIACHKVT